MEDVEEDAGTGGSYAPDGVQLICEPWLLVTLFNESPYNIVRRCIESFEAFRVMDDEHVIVRRDDLLNIVFAGAVMPHRL